MTWSLALLWLISGAIIGVYGWSRLESYALRHCRIVAFGLCGHEKCDRLHAVLRMEIHGATHDFNFSFTTSPEVRAVVRDVEDRIGDRVMKYACHYCKGPTSMGPHITADNQDMLYPSACLKCTQAGCVEPIPVSMVSEEVLANARESLFRLHADNDDQHEAAE